LRLQPEFELLDCHWLTSETNHLPEDDTRIRQLSATLSYLAILFFCVSYRLEMVDIQASTNCPDPENGIRAESAWHTIKYDIKGVPLPLLETTSSLLDRQGCKNPKRGTLVCSKLRHFAMPEGNFGSTSLAEHSLALETFLSSVKLCKSLLLPVFSTFRNC
jgi:hypothetical protein